MVIKAVTSTEIELQVSPLHLVDKSSTISTKSPSGLVNIQCLLILQKTLTYVADAFNTGGEKRGQAFTSTEGFCAGAILKVFCCFIE